MNLQHVIEQRQPASLAWLRLMVFGLFAFGGIQSIQADETIDFGRDVQPILSNHCYQCHGSDAETREAELRLDRRDVAMETGAINVATPEASELLKRVRSTDPSIVMPPPEINKTLSSRQVQILEKWIAQGATYDAHWAFQRIQKPTVPSTADDPWCRNEIDAFVLNRLREKKFTPSPEASREVLIRRLYQDLLGLLPSPEEVDAYVNDSSPTADQDLVDRLLASPHYGERWGRHWLDQARYADSNGYTIDGPRVMWPYRDWVIAAFNRDLPFDQFTIEQLAGDLLSEPTKQQLVATAFHRNTMINQEGGVKADQYRNEALVDRVNTTGAVWLGLTIGCAQCHSHKFDPITHDEYYSLYAFFNDAADANNVGPTVDVHEAEMFGWTDLQYQQAKELQQLRNQVAALEKQAGETSPLGTAQWKWDSPQLVSQHTESGAQLKRLEDGSLLAEADVAANDAYHLELQSPAQASETPYVLTAIRLRVLTDPSLPKNGPGRAGNGNFVLTSLELERNGTRVPLVEAWADHSQNDYSIDGVIDDDSQTGWAINVDGAQAKAGKKMNAPHEAILALAEPLNLQQDQLTIHLRHGRNANYQLGRFAIDFTSTPLPTPADKQKINADLAAAKTRVAELEAALPGQGLPVKQMVIKSQAKHPETYRLIRGDFLDPDQQAGPLDLVVPAALVTESTSPTLESRLQLAQWLVSRENPLTARVTVNRIWARYFGRGIVETENDFGLQGTPPTHPELLDWLAVTFMEQGWSMKDLHRLIVQSATYRQSSDVRTELTEADPGNYWLARQSRFRVEAEIVRDQALAASGLLTPHIGGPSVFPPQPDGVYNFTQNKKSWPTETGANRYRRTMYTMFYRSAPYPLLSTFDVPDFSTTCTRRVRSNTPLQSLTMANDVVFQEFATGLATRVWNQETNASIQDDCHHMFRIALTRAPSAAELNILTQFYEREFQRFQDTPEDAEQFVHGKLEGTDRLRLAALASVARVILNTDEFVTRN